MEAAHAGQLSKLAFSCQNITSAVKKSAGIAIAEYSFSIIRYLDTETVCGSPSVATDADLVPALA
jgi:hypothetical protein